MNIFFDKYLIFSILPPLIITIVKFDKTANFTYQSYLHSIRYSPHDIDKIQIAELLSYYKGHVNLFNEVVPLFFVIDYTRMRYLFFSESSKQVMGYDAMQLLQDGLGLTMDLMQKDYWKTYNTKIFPAVAQFLNKHPLHEHQNLNFSFNAHLKCANKKWINLLQNSRYITSQTTGLPLYCLGMVIDITSFKADNFMNYKVEWINKQTGQIKPLDQKRFYVFDEDKLLTTKEKLVLNHIADGLSSKMIAAKLKISENTIDNHRQNMLNKTETNNVAQLVAFGIRNGII